MPRTGRIVIPGVPMHVTQRGNDRMAVFNSRQDCAHYIELLRSASARTSCAIHAYALMSNHVHLLLTPKGAEGIAAMMQWVGARYVRFFNDRYGRTGTLWEGRFKSTPVSSDQYYFTCARYIELNPVRAGMVDHPMHYPWSSYRRNALGRRDPLITSHPLYTALGETAKQRCLAYADLFTTHVDPAIVDAIRLSTARGHMLGGRRLRDDLAARALQPQQGARRSWSAVIEPFWQA
jgi:putative transposase